MQSLLRLQILAPGRFPRNSTLSSCLPAIFKMKLLSVLGSLLCVSIALAGPVVEKRVPGQGFQDPELQARAQSYFLNQKSKGKCSTVHYTERD